MRSCELILRPMNTFCLTVLCTVSVNLSEWMARITQGDTLSQVESGVSGRRLMPSLYGPKLDFFYTNLGVWNPDFGFFFSTMQY